MKWIAILMVILSFGIVDGSDTQGFEITTGMYILLFSNLLGAFALLYKTGKDEIDG